MKRSFVFIFLLFVLGVTLSACTDSPGIEQSALPSDFFVLKAKESGEVEYPPTEDIVISTPSPVFPAGTYILLRNTYGTNLFRLSFFSDGKEVCHWENEISHPYNFEQKGIVYISEQNCAGMGENVVSWDLSQEKASLNGEDVSVWTLTGSVYFKN